jgi:tetratricopeptide (TPR) repeat protein
VRLTEAVAREACQRQNVKAMLSGSIAPIGSAYVITVNATECKTGRQLATEQVQAARREDALNELGRAAKSVREKLGESLATLEKFDVPLERATTTSLEALKAYTTGNQLHMSGQPLKAIPHFERAVSLDPEFALAYAQMSTSYFNLRDNARSKTFAERAYELRDRVSDRERFYIESRYHNSVAGDFDLTLKVYEIWSQTYPREYVAWNNMGVMHAELGDLERAVDAYAQSKRLHPGNNLTYGNMAIALLGLNRLDEAKIAADEAIAKHPTNVAYLVRFSVACFERDAAKKDELIAIGRSRQIPEIFAWALHCALHEGRLVEARNLQQEGAQIFGESRSEPRARLIIELAFGEWRLGRPERARALADEADRLLATAAPFHRLAALYADIGEQARARALLDSMAAHQPQATFLTLWRGVAEATMALSRKDWKAALDQLQPLRRFEFRYGDVTLTRARAHLVGGNAAAAVADFKRIVDAPPLGPAGTVYSSALIGLARARVAAGDTAGARAAYDQFLDLWKDADADLALLAEARRERNALK